MYKCAQCGKPIAFTDDNIQLRTCNCSRIMFENDVEKIIPSKIILECEVKMQGIGKIKK